MVGYLNRAVHVPIRLRQAVIDGAVDPVRLSQLSGVRVYRIDCIMDGGAGAFQDLLDLEAALDQLEAMPRAGEALPEGW